MSDVDDSSDSISTVGVKLCPFWDEEPDLWFVQAEQIFALKKITADATKFAHIVGALPKDVARSVKDILISPPSSDRFVALKKRLCASFNPSTYKSAHKLVSLPAVPNEKPSRVMERMLNLLPADTKPCWLFQYHFLQKLPQELRCELSRLDLAEFVSKPRELSLEANKHWEKRALDADRPTLSVLPAPEPEPEVCRVNRPTPTKSSPQREPALCYYHSNFGGKALKCRNPCSWTGNGSARSRSRN